MNNRIATRALLAAALLSLVVAVPGCGVSSAPPVPPTPTAAPAAAPAPKPAPAPATDAAPTPRSGAQPPPRATAHAPMPAPSPGPPQSRSPAATPSVAPTAPSTVHGDEAAAESCASVDLAAFPWPKPPAPSDRALIPPYLLWPAGSAGKTLMDVGRRLEGSIASAGYLEPRYLGAGCNGFAIMLDLEQIDADGTRKPGAAGFAPSTAEPGFTLRGYLQRLFYAPPGYYRQIVLVVSDQGIAATTPAPTPGELRAIGKDGRAALPPGYAKLPFSWKYEVVALVYEFQKGPADGDASQIPANGRLRAPQHLKQAHLY